MAILAKRCFVPRANQSRQRSFPSGWETSLVAPWGHSWAFQWDNWTVLEGSTRKSLITQARKITKKLGVIKVQVHPGQVTTARPVGTRMGKGKGKPHSTRTWLCRGASLLLFRGPQPAGWSTLSKRSPRGAAKLIPLGW